jgi:hypothetical protein
MSPETYPQSRSVFWSRLKRPFGSYGEYPSLPLPNLGIGASVGFGVQPSAYPAAAAPASVGFAPSHGNAETRPEKMAEAENIQRRNCDREDVMSAVC